MLNDHERVILVPDDSVHDSPSRPAPGEPRFGVANQLGRRNPIAEIEHCCWPGCSADRYEEPDSPPFCVKHMLRCAVYVSSTVRHLIDPLHEGASRNDRLPVQQRDSVVYYVRIGDHVKIGTTTNLKRRLEGMYVAHDPHALLAVETGDQHLERRRHAQFASERVYANRELFNPSPRLLAHIEQLNAVTAVQV